MSLVSYADLQTQVANWLARTDLNPFIPDMITLFEAAAARKLKVRQQETTVSLATTNGVATLPSDFLGYRRVTWVGSFNVDLDYVHPSVWQFYEPTTIQGTPQVFTIEGGNLSIAPLDDSGLQLVYNQKTPALSSSLNWLYTNYPDVYLFGTLCEANFFNKGSALPLAAMWKQRRDEAFDEIQRVDFNERQGMAIRVFGITP